jgi:hypothetical protein
LADESVLIRAGALDGPKEKPLGANDKAKPPTLPKSVPAFGHLNDEASGSFDVDLNFWNFNA